MNEISTTIEDVKLWPILERMAACSAAMEWLEDYEFETFEDAWRTCTVHGWLTFVLAQWDDDDHIYSHAIDLSFASIDSSLDYLKQPDVIARVKEWLLDYGRTHVLPLEEQARVGDLLLMPILCVMGASAEFRMWIMDNKIRTFEEAWSRCDEHSFLDEVVGELDETPEIRELQCRFDELVGTKSYLLALNHYKTVEAVSVIKAGVLDYAKRRGCARPCTSPS